ncbi:hypothetical protein D3C76_1267460 [compost metagenome]
MAFALSSPRCLVAIVAGAQWGVVARPAGQSAAGILVVVHGGGSADLHLQRSPRALALVANLDPRPMVDCTGAVPVVAGAGVAGQCQRPPGQPVGGALDQSGGTAASLVGYVVAARSLRRRRFAVAGGWFDRLAVHGPEVGGWPVSRVASHGDPVVDVGPRGIGGLFVVAAAWCADAPAGLAAAAGAGVSFALRVA